MDTLLLAVCVSYTFIKIPGSLQLLSVVATAGTTAAAGVRVLRCDAAVPPMVMVYQRVFVHFRLPVVVVLLFWCFSAWCTAELGEDNSDEDLGKQSL